MDKKIKEISVFFPTYNEEENIEKVVKKAKKVLDSVAEKWEILIVNDGSLDNTLKIAEKLAKNDKHIKVVNHKVNQGYGGALKSGFKKAMYPWVAFTDSDGQFDFAEINKFLPFTSTHDVILGYRLKRADSIMRSIYTYAWGMLPRVLWGMNVRDYSCGFKLIKKKVFMEIQPLVGEEKVTQIEMLVKAKKAGFRFVEVGVHHYPREFGKQTGANVKVVAKSITDLIKLWQKLQ